MNIIFWGLLLAMLLVAIILLVIPLLRVRNDNTIAYTQSNLSIHDDKLRELEHDLEDGRIDQEHYRLAKMELDRELLIDIPEETADNASTHYTKKAIRQPALAISIAVFLPLLTLLVYLDLGMHAAGDGEVVAAQQQPNQVAQHKEMSIPQMVERLKNRIAQHGGSAQDYAMLGRAYKFMQQYENASLAFKKSLEIDQKDVAVMLEYAEALALSNGRRFTPEALDLVHKAAAIAPDTANVLWFAGVAEYQTGNYTAAITNLVRLADTDAVKDKDVRDSIIAYVSKARDKLVAQGKPVPELGNALTLNDSHPDNTASTVSKQADNSGGAVLHVHVDISDEVKRQFKDSDTIFVYAKAQQGPRMPLAVQRMKLSQLPANVTLDDSMAMVDGMNISNFGKVVVSARVSPSGSAIAQPGDYIGKANVDNVHTDKVINISINQKVN